MKEEMGASSRVEAQQAIGIRLHRGRGAAFCRIFPRPSPQPGEHAQHHTPHPRGFAGKQGMPPRVQREEAKPACKFGQGDVRLRIV